MDTKYITVDKSAVPHKTNGTDSTGIGGNLALVRDIFYKVDGIFSEEIVNEAIKEDDTSNINYVLTGRNSVSVDEYDLQHGTNLHGTVQSYPEDEKIEKRRKVTQHSRVILNVDADDKMRGSFKNDIDFFERYGIYFSTDIFDDSSLVRLVLVPEYIFRLGPIVLRRFLEVEMTASRRAGYTDVDFLFDVDYAEQNIIIGKYLRDTEIYHDICEDFNLLNLNKSKLNSLDVKQGIRRHKIYAGKKLVNIAAFLCGYDYVVETDSYAKLPEWFDSYQPDLAVDRQILAYSSVLDRCIALGRNKDLCFYYDETEDLVKEHPSSVIRSGFFKNNLLAAFTTILIMNDVVVYTTYHDISKISTNFNKFLLAEYNYFEDYVNFLRNPYGAALRYLTKGSMQSIVTLMCVKKLQYTMNLVEVEIADVEEENEYDFYYDKKNEIYVRKGVAYDKDLNPTGHDLSYYYVELPDFSTFPTESLEIKETKKRLRLVGHDSEQVILDDRNLEIVPIRSLYDLHTKDWKVGKREDAALCGILRNVRNLIKHDNSNKSMAQRSMDCSNTLLFRTNGKLYLGYVWNISYEALYSSTTLKKGFNYISEVVLTEEDLPNLLDIRAFGDYEVLFKYNPKLLDYIRRGEPENCRGFLVGSVYRRSGNLTDKCGLYYDEAALHAKFTKYLRGSNVKYLVQCGIPVEGLQNEVLTFFGGPHPSQNTHTGKYEFEISSKLWRN